MKLGDEYGTPDDLYDVLWKKFGPFTMDGAATLENTKLTGFTSDASLTTWCGDIWLNPPYSKMKYFAKLADDYASLGHKVTMLCRADVSTRWWQKHIHGRPVYMLRRRVKFIGATQVYNFPVAVVHFNGAGPQMAQYRYLEEWK